MPSTIMLCGALIVQPHMRMLVAMISPVVPQGQNVQESIQHCS